MLGTFLDHSPMCENEKMAFQNFLKIYLYVRVLHPCMDVQHLHTVFVEAKEGVGTPGTGVTDRREQPSGCEGPNPVI